MINAKAKNRDESVLGQSTNMQSKPLSSEFPLLDGLDFESMDMDPGTESFDASMFFNLNSPNQVFNVADDITGGVISDISFSGFTSTITSSDLHTIQSIETVGPFMNILPPIGQPMFQQPVEYDTSVGNTFTTTEELVNSIDNILENDYQSVKARVNLLENLATTALDGDLIQYLKGGKQRKLMKYIEAIQQKSYEEQKAIASFVFNLSQIISDIESRLWLFCHIREVIIVAKFCMVQQCVWLKGFGTSIVHNLASKVGNDLIPDISFDLTSTLITFVSQEPIEEHLFTALSAICSLLTVSDVNIRIKQSVGYLSRRGISMRCDELIDQINQTTGNF
ncbi:uncharacterized protein LOC129567293 isoform X2 [Sitodiplosis mosellana]|nr:uncharacterized protein LOC129567293 isoform X2 [Sitodiplosis mosellana]